MSQPQRENYEEEVKQIVARANNSVQCSLCRLNYPKTEVTKIASMKMLFELKQHLNKRGIFWFEHLDMFRGHQLSCKLCDICYMLVVAEHELIDIEETVAWSLGIPKIEDEENDWKKNKMIRESYKQQQ